MHGAHSASEIIIIIAEEEDEILSSAQSLLWLVKLHCIAYGRTSGQVAQEGICKTVHLASFALLGYLGAPYPWMAGWRWGISIYRIRECGVQATKDVRCRTSER